MGGNCCALLQRGRDMGPHLTQCGLGWGLPSYQVASWSIQPFGQNTPTLQTGQTDRQTDGQRSDRIGRANRFTHAQNCPPRGCQEHEQWRDWQPQWGNPPVTPVIWDSRYLSTTVHCVSGKQDTRHLVNIGLHKFSNSLTARSLRKLSMYQSQTVPYQLHCVYTVMRTSIPKFKITAKLLLTSAKLICFTWNLRKFIAIQMTHATKVLQWW